MNVVNPVFAWGLALAIIIFVVVLTYCKMNDYSLLEALNSIKDFFRGEA